MNRKVIEIELNNVKNDFYLINRIYVAVGIIKQEEIDEKAVETYIANPNRSLLGDSFIGHMREFPRFENEARPLEVHMILRGWSKFYKSNEKLSLDLLDCLAFVTDKKKSRYDDIDFTFSVSLD